MEEDRYDRYLDEKISKATGIPISELTFEKIHTLVSSTDYTSILLSPRGGKIEIERKDYTRDEIEAMRRENDEFLRQYLPSESRSENNSSD